MFSLTSSLPSRTPSDLSLSLSALLPPSASSPFSLPPPVSLSFSLPPIPPLPPLFPPSPPPPFQYLDLYYGKSWKTPMFSEFKNGQWQVRVKKTKRTEKNKENRTEQNSDEPTSDNIRHIGHMLTLTPIILRPTPFLLTPHLLLPAPPCLFLFIPFFLSPSRAG